LPAGGIEKPAAEMCPGGRFQEYRFPNRSNDQQAVTPFYHKMGQSKQCSAGLVKEAFPHNYAESGTQNLIAGLASCSIA
jgi:hypothetical protein